MILTSFRVRMRAFCVWMCVCVCIGVRGCVCGGCGTDVVLLLTEGC